MSLVRIVGHRGAAAVAPENTIPSFFVPFEHNVTAIELDVRLTRDGVVVCFHDDRLDRITSLRGLVAGVDWSELSLTTVLADAFGGAFPRAHVPRLDAVFAALPVNARLMVELKADPERGEELVRRTLEIIADAGAGDRTRTLSFETDLLEKVRELRRSDSPPLGVIVGPSEIEALIPRAEALGAAAVHAPHRLIDQALVQRAHDAGLLINAWTVNDVEAARRLAALGVDEITSDDPGLLIEAGL